MGLKFFNSFDKSNQGLQGKRAEVSEMIRLFKILWNEADGSK